MRIILHIGQHKTGSTALQAALWGDRPRLRRLGILYPAAGHMRPKPNFLAPSHNGLFFGLNGTKGPSTWQTLDEMQAQFAAEIEEHQPHTVVVSSERGFMVVDQDPDLLPTLDTLLPGDKDVVAYLRRPDRFLASYHRQLIEMGRRHLGPLHAAARLRELEDTFQLNYTGALGVYDERYGPATLHNYEDVDDTIGHFYREVLGVDPPRRRPARTNPSLPMVLTDLALQDLDARGHDATAHVKTLLAYGDREKVDLLGPENRERLAAWFAPQNAELGRRVGRDAFFDDLAAITDIPPDWLTVEQANEKYRRVFEGLVAPCDVAGLRRDCVLLEADGRWRAAGVLYRNRAHTLSDEDVAWFRADLEAASGGRWTIGRGGYVHREKRRRHRRDSKPHQAARSLVKRVGRRVLAGLRRGR